MLINWRIRAGYTDDEAEQILNYPSGKIQEYENEGLTKIPLCEVGRIAELYEVSQAELLEILILETAKIRPDFFRF
jgi:uncharacterized pyridoxamine 5'-phosphate oxidase family protein